MTAEPLDEAEAYDGRDWNGDLHGRASLPTDSRMFWIVTDEGEAHEVAYDDERLFWTGREAWVRQDGEHGSWERDEIKGWSSDRTAAERAAAELLEYFR